MTDKLFNESDYPIENKLDRKQVLRDFYIKKGQDKCLRCNRTLSDPNSMKREYGKICFNKEFGVNQSKIINN